MLEMIGATLIFLNYGQGCMVTDRKDSDKSVSMKLVTELNCTRQLYTLELRILIVVRLFLLCFLS